MKEPTPEDVLNQLKQGNKEFAADKLTVRNTCRRIRESALGQSPKAAVVSCLDSRVPVEDVFHMGIGDIFVARIAGNFVNEDILGSLEFACKVSSAKLILILGHEHCGAIQAAISGVEVGHITNLLSKIQPAIASAEVAFYGDKTADNPEFVSAVCIENVKHAINVIRTQSPILREMEANGEIKIVGGVYCMTTGKVSFLQ